MLGERIIIPTRDVSWTPFTARPLVRLFRTWQLRCDVSNLGNHKAQIKIGCTPI